MRRSRCLAALTLLCVSLTVARAAGLAIVEGAGGTTRWAGAGAEYVLNVEASNGRLAFID